MLLPDNIKPEFSIFYIGSLILNELHNSASISLLDLYQIINSKNGIGFSLYSLSLDWLYLIDAARIDDTGEVRLCI